MMLTRGKKMCITGSEPDPVMKPLHEIETDIEPPGVPRPMSRKSEQELIDIILKYSDTEIFQVMQQFALREKPVQTMSGTIVGYEQSAKLRNTLLGGLSSR